VILTYAVIAAGRLLVVAVLSDAELSYLLAVLTPIHIIIYCIAPRKLPPFYAIFPTNPATPDRRPLQYTSISFSVYPSITNHH